MITGAINSGMPANSLKSKNSELKAEDFINMMITQLQNQDPMEPAKNEELLAQMSQIGQLQSATAMQETMKGLMLQTQIGSAGNLIGKTIEGLDAKNEPVTGVVNSIRVEGDTVHLELDNGKTIPVGRVTKIAETTISTTTA